NTPLVAAAEILRAAPSRQLAMFGRFGNHRDERADRQIFKVLAGCSRCLLFAPRLMLERGRVSPSPVPTSPAHPYPLFSQGCADAKWQQAGIAVDGLKDLSCLK